MQAFPAIARSHMAKKAQLLGIWLRAMLDFRERESCFLLTDVSIPVPSLQILSTCTLQVLPVSAMPLQSLQVTRYQQIMIVA